MQSSLYAPWRMEYIRTLDKQKGGECFLCQAAAAQSPQEKRQRLVLWTTDQIVVVINKYPYSNGHILVSPIAHKAELEDLTDTEVAAMQKESVAVVRLLKRAISPQGFNVGINLGRCAGAGRRPRRACSRRQLAWCAASAGRHRRRL